MPSKKVPYALANPLSVFLNKPSEDFGRKDCLKVIEKKGIERITFHYTALDGKLKELRLPVVNQRQAERILAEGERVDGSSLFKGIVDTSLSDLYVVPDYRTAFLSPFDSGSLDLICRYITKDGEWAPFALDNILRRACLLFKEKTGCELYTLGELEFFLIRESDNPIFSLQKQKGYHESSPFIKGGGILNEMVRYLAQITEAVKYAHSEVGSIDMIRSDLDAIHGRPAEQLEVEFLPRPAERMADALVLGRWLIRNVAYRCGYVATFTPKIAEGVAGNGLHFHMEVRKNGKNVMVDRKGNLSKEAFRLIGGLCEYAGSLTAFGNTVSSAYLRLVPNQEAPTRICWSDLNRSAMIRVPLGWAKVNNLAKKVNPQERTTYGDQQDSQTVELRSPDGSAIVHLLLAGIVMAAEWGFQNNRALKTAEKLYMEGNVFTDSKLMSKLPALPVSCVESSKLLMKKRNLYEREGVFPSSVVEYVAKLLLAENDELMNQKLSDLPADERLHETRKIMHKDLHRH